MAACTDCEPTIFFDSSDEYIRHLKQHHYAGSSGRFQCPLCYVTYSRMILFEKHLTKCFKNQEKMPASFRPHYHIEINSVADNTVVETGQSTRTRPLCDDEAVYSEQ